jgi:hypothetical protein
VLACAASPGSQVATIAPDGGLATTASAHGKIAVWDARSGRTSYTLAGADRISALAFLDDRRSVSASPKQAAGGLAACDRGSFFRTRVAAREEP